MIDTTFAGQGIDLDGHVLSKADVHPTLTADQAFYKDSIMEMCRAHVGTVNEPAILKELRSVTDKHSLELSNEALLDILAATIDTRIVNEDRMAAASEAFLLGAATQQTASQTRTEPDVQAPFHQHVLGDLNNESFQERLRQTEHDIYTSPDGKQNMASFEKYRQKHKEMWDFVRGHSEDEWLKAGTTLAQQLKKLSDDYRKDLSLFDGITGDMIKDILDMEQIIKSKTRSPWKLYFQRLVASFAG